MQVIGSLVNVESEWRVELLGLIYVGSKSGVAIGDEIVVIKVKDTE